MLLREASATTSSAGKPRSSRMLSISRPTLPVAPTTATLKPMKLLLPLSAVAVLEEPADRRGPRLPGPDPGGTVGQGRSDRFGGRFGGDRFGRSGAGQE